MSVKQCDYCLNPFQFDADPATGSALKKRDPDPGQSTFTVSHRCVCREKAF